MRYSFRSLWLWKIVGFIEWCIGNREMHVHMHICIWRDSNLTGVVGVNNCTYSQRWIILELNEHTFLVGEVKKRWFACWARKKSSHREDPSLSLSLCGMHSNGVFSLLQRVKHKKKIKAQERKELCFLDSCSFFVTLQTKFSKKQNNNITRVCPFCFFWTIPSRN